MRVLFDETAIARRNEEMARFIAADPLQAKLQAAAMVEAVQLLARTEAPVLTRLALSSEVEDVARAIGKPAAMRAVGSACGANPAALLIPCHRALRTDGGMGGYAWGLGRKKELLRIEAREKGKRHRGTRHEGKR